MKRIMCIWFPRWPVQRILAECPGYEHQAIVVYGATSRLGEQVFVCNELAEACGVQEGMPLAEVRALPAWRQQVPVFLQHDPERDRAALGAAAVACEEFSPLVGLAEASRPDSLLLDVTGLERFFRGEKNLARQVVKTWQVRGQQVQVALADTPSAAWAAARFAVGESAWLVVPSGSKTLMFSLPLAGLRLSSPTEQSLQQLGLTRIGELARMNRNSLKARFGPEIGLQLDRMLGIREEIILPERAETCLQAKWEWESPTANSQGIKHVLNYLFERLALSLQSQQQGCLELTCQLKLECASPVTLELQLFEPTACANTLYELLQLQLERQRIRSSLCAICLTVKKSATLVWRQQELFAARSMAQTEALAGLINRLSSRLGRERVVRFQIKSAAVPEQAYAYVPAIHAPVRRTKNQAACFAATERPLWLYATPRSLAVQIDSQNEPVAFQCDGRTYFLLECERVERIESAWWQGRMVRRDYYRVMTSTGERFWLFQRRQNKRWFLQGEFR